MRVEFHTDVADPLEFACRLLRKVYRNGSRAAVYGPGPALARLDQALWTSDALDFIPHARWNGQNGPSPGAGLGRTPIWLCEPGAPPPPGCTIAVNVALDDLATFDPYERLIEIVSRDQAVTQAARARWRVLSERGIQIEHHPHRDADGAA